MILSGWFKFLNFIVLHLWNRYNHNVYLAEVLSVSGLKYAKKFRVIQYENVKIIIEIKFSYWVICYLKLNFCLITF